MKPIKASISLAVGLLWLATLHAQVQFVPGEYFPADLEFRELHPDGAAASATNTAALSKADGSKLLIEVGFEKYAKQAYSADDSGTLSIEIVTLKDARASYSILTLLRGSEIFAGPPGNAYSMIAGEMLFAHGNRWVRLRGYNISQDLLRRAAMSVSNRMGPTTASSPSLIRHFPKLGFDGSSVRYFLGPQSLKEHSLSLSGALRMKFLSDMEIAQAHYALDNKSGLLSLISFPTSQMAEDYFESVAGLSLGSPAPGGRVYVKKAGPLLALMEGSFDPATADSILSEIQFAYSIKWIYDRNSRPDIVFGVPVRILGTVVRSLVFVALLALASIMVGTGFAFLRIGLRTYAPNSYFCRKEHNRIIRLKINEN